MRSTVFNMVSFGAVFLFCLGAFQTTHAQGDFTQEEVLALVKRFKDGIAATFPALNRPVEAKGRPFPPIQGPACKSDRIGIVGAGWAGIDMAYRLTKMGYTNVTILERLNRFGGKSFHVIHRNTINSMTTLLITKSSPIRKYMAQFNITGTIKNTETPRIYFSNATSDADKSGLFADLIKYQIGVLGATSPETAIDNIIKAFAKYINLHQKLFGKYEGHLMNRPSKKTLQRTQVSLTTFLKRNDMLALLPVFESQFTAYGYGKSSETSAIYHLIVLNPLLLFDSFDYHLYSTNGVFDNVMRNLIKDGEIDIQYGVDVQSVRRIPNGDAQSFKLLTSAKTYDFDFIMWSGLLPDFEAVAKGFKFSSYKKNILKSSITYPTTSALVLLENDISFSPVQLFPEALDAFNNSIYLHFDSQGLKLNLKGDTYTTRDYLIDGEPANERVATVILYSEKNYPSQDLIRERIKQHYINGFGATRVDIPVMETFDYFPHFPLGSKFNHWELFDKFQGKQGMFFIGSVVSFESTQDVLEYNKLLLRQMMESKTKC